MDGVQLPEYVYDLLDRISEENGFKYYFLTTKQGSQPGDGFTSEISSVTITEKNNDKKLHLVCKVAPLDRNCRKEYFTESMFNREATFYNEVLPNFLKFQQEKNLFQSKQFLVCPKCYAAITDDQNEQFVIVLEDIRPQGFKLWQKTKTATIENMQLIMREMGKLHGISMAMKHQRPKEFAKFEKNIDLCREYIKSKSVQAMFEASYDQAITSLKKDEHKSIMRELKQNFSHYYNSVLSEKCRFAVICHGDLWNNNILLRFNKNGIADDIKLLDWQLMKYASPVIDLVYVIFTSTDKALRDQEYENLLLHFYYDSLSKTITSLGSDPIELFSFENLQNELKRYGCFGLLQTPLILQYLLLTDSYETVNSSDMEKECQKHLITESNGRSEYARRLNEVFEDIVNLGYYYKMN